MASQGTSRQGGHGGWIYSAYRRKLKGIGPKDGGGKQMKRRAVYATVASPLGPQPAAGLTLREIRCPVPRTRREKYLLGAPKE